MPDPISDLNADGKIDADDYAIADFGPRPPPLPPNAKRFLGMNFPTPNDSTAEFSNLFKTSRGFRPPDYPYAYKGGPLLDNVGDPLGDFGSRLLTDITPKRAGVYTFLGFCAALPKVKTFGSNKITSVKRDSASGLVTALIEVKPGGSNNVVGLDLVVTDTAGGIKNPRCYPPGINDDSGTFNPDFLKAADRYDGFRLMGWQRTNQKGAKDASGKFLEDALIVREWSDVALPRNPVWTGRGGIPVGVCLELGKRLRKLVWINIPAEASDNYVAAVGNAIRELGAPIVYVEYGNELTFNWDYAGTHYNHAKAEQEAKAGVDYGTKDANHRRYRRVVRRSVQIKQLLGNSSAIRMVLPTQTNTGKPGEVLASQLTYCEQKLGQPRNFFYGCATAPYTSPGKVEVTGKEALANYQSGSFNEADARKYPDKKISVFFTARKTPTLTVDELVTRCIERAPGHGATAGQMECARLATSKGMRAVGYEIGGDWQQYPNHVDVKKQAQYDPRQSTITETYLVGKQEQGKVVGGCFGAGGMQEGFYLQMHGPFGMFGFWALGESFLDTNTPKHNGAQNAKAKLK